MRSRALVISGLRVFSKRSVQLRGIGGVCQKLAAGRPMHETSNCSRAGDNVRKKPRKPSAIWRKLSWFRPRPRPRAIISSRLISIFSPRPANFAEICSRACCPWPLAIMKMASVARSPVGSIFLSSPTMACSSSSPRKPGPFAVQAGNDLGQSGAVRLVAKGY